MELTAAETRVIGALIEKEITTPDQYPLSLNALANACNQKSNRDPVMQLAEGEVQQTVDGLIAKHLISEKSGFGSRVAKYQHRFCNSQFGNLQFSDAERAVVCVLLLRGPQTPGELRSRSQRLHAFKDVNEVEATLEHLTERDDGPFVARLAREPGRRESRFAHLFSGAVQTEAPSTDHPSATGTPTSDRERIEQLERMVSELRQEIGAIRAELERFGRP